MTPIPIREYDRQAVLTLLDDLVVQLHAKPDPKAWENRSLPEYLEAFRAWLGDCDGYFRNMGREVPDNPWEIIWHALHAAPSYE